MRQSLRRRVLRSIGHDDPTQAAPDSSDPDERQHGSSLRSDEINDLFERYKRLLRSKYGPPYLGGPGTAASLDIPETPRAAEETVNRLQDLQTKTIEGLIDMLDSQLDRSGDSGTSPKQQANFETIAQIVSKVPEGDDRDRLSSKIIDQLWSSLEHPPTSNIGPKYRFRQADGSLNNLCFPDLGKAGSAYARTVKPTMIRSPEEPDPEHIFNTLMARDKNKFKPHPSGISSAFFYLASVIIHDLFKTSYHDVSISLTSSYLDLSPLYGCNQEEQDTVRTFVDGKLKPDCFSEKRILGFPPGVSCLLVVVEQLAEINEDDRFVRPAGVAPQTNQQLKKLDENLFQTGRLITCSHYTNIILHDYLRVILGLNTTKSNWWLDPRVKQNDLGPPRAVGNQCSFEFNLVYRWHSAVSQKDEKWMEDFFGDHFKDLPAQHTLEDHVAALLEFEKSIPSKPEDRSFGGLERGPDGRFRDEDLARMWRQASEDLAGAFGANNTPHALRVIEILGIKQARAWQAASLNDFREAFGLKAYSSFEEINPDPNVAKALRALYKHPDCVEMYPGLMSEEGTPGLLPASGLNLPHSMSRAILSDAVAVIRGDRFYTVDYHPMNLTYWGYNEAESNVAIDDGCVFYKLIHRALPNSFAPDSIYAHLPLITPTRNLKTLVKLERPQKYSFGIPATRAQPVRVTDPIAIKALLASEGLKGESWLIQLKHLMGKPGKLVRFHGDVADFQRRRRRIEEQLISFKLKAEFEALLEGIGKEVDGVVICSHGTKSLSRANIQAFAQIAPIRFLAAILPLPLRNESRPDGFTEPQLFATLELIFKVLFEDLAPVETFEARTAARPLAAVLGEVLEMEINRVPGIAILSASLRSIKLAAAGEELPRLGIDFVRRLLAAGVSVCEIAWVDIMPALSAFAINVSKMLCCVVEYYLGEGRSHLGEIRNIVAGEGNDDMLLHFAMEAIRLRGCFGFERTALSDEALPGHPVPLKKGTRIVVYGEDLSRNAAVYPRPQEVLLTRLIEKYHFVGFGPNQALGSALSRVTLVGLFKGLMSRL